MTFINKYRSGAQAKTITKDEMDVFRLSISFIEEKVDDFADHYGTVIVPARVRKPQDKSLVENAVKFVYRRIYSSLRNKTFNTPEQLNEAIWGLLEKYNQQQFQRLDYSRADLFTDVEHKALIPLPPEKQPIRKTILAAVQSNYHIEIREDRLCYIMFYPL